MASGIGAVVPPAEVPEALEQRRRMAGNEVDVGADRLLDEPQNSTAGVFRRESSNRCLIIRDQLKREAGLGLGFQERQIHQGLCCILDPIRSQQMADPIVKVIAVHAFVNQSQSMASTQGTPSPPISRLAT